MTIPNWEDRTILIVEDDEISMEFLTELLAPSNVKIVVARDGKQAVNFCENNKAIDVVLMDVRLPKMNGKEAMEEIKKKQTRFTNHCSDCFCNVRRQGKIHSKWF
jgi:two-component system cell cycle response regulator DivK